jgi:hypothetical protein
MSLSSVAGILVSNLIAHGFSDFSPIIIPMSSNGFVGSNVSWKAQKIRSELINTDLV